MWAAGDYASWGDRFAEVGRRVVDVAGLDVLDVATGHGPTAIAAALAGGRVTGVDITSELLAVARRRAAEAGVRVEWVEADMLSVPLPDGSFDRVLSTFGAMTAPDQQAVARELVRRCRPGGVIASTAWSPDSVYSKIGGIVVGFLGDEDAGTDEAEPAPAPSAWADPAAVRSIFAGLPVAVTTTARTVTVRWPSTDAVLDVLPEFGPLAGVVATLRDDGTWAAARAALAEMLAAEAADAQDGLVIEVPYAVTIAKRHGRA